MSSDSGQKGRLAALQIVNKLRRVPPEAKPPPPVDLSPLADAVKALSTDPVDLSPVLEAISATKPEALDLSGLIKAISKLKLDAGSVSVDVAPIAAQIEALAKKPATNFKPVVDKLDGIKKAMEENTKVLSDLVRVAETPKIVKYDDLGRIVEIGIRK